MELLTIEHKDFTLIVECTKFDGIWNKAKSNVGEDKLYSTYSWSEGVVSVKRTLDADHEIDIEQGIPAPATFFDNADYPIWIEFKDYVKDAQFGSILQNDNDRFSFRRHILAGFINYKNEIGRSEIQIIYKVDKETRTFRFGFEVLSTKLDYHEHWRTSKEKEYVMCMRLSRCGLSQAKRQNKRMKMMPTAKLSAWLSNFGMSASNMQNSNR